MKLAAHSAKLAARDGGFTLIELLIVIGIIGFLAASVLVAVDPVKRIQDARDARRYAEANAMLNAILNKQVDDRAIFDGVTGVGEAPIITQAGSNVQVIVESSAGIVCNSQTTRPGCNKAMDTGAADKDCVADLLETATGTSLVPNYLAAIPRDPRGDGLNFCGTGSGCTTLGDLNIGATNSGYYLARTGGNRLEIGSCKGEQTATISVKR